MLLVVGLCLLAFIVIVKIWIVGVKFVGSKLKVLLKPIYRFFLRLCPVTVVICTVFLAIILFVMVKSSISGSGEDIESTEVIEEETDENDAFVTAFIGRAEHRVWGFANIILDNTDSIYKVLGANANGEIDGPLIKSIIMMLVVLILLPFIVLSLIAILSILALLEIFALTLVIDALIFVVRCIRYRGGILEKVLEWWIWAKE